MISSSQPARFTITEPVPSVPNTDTPRAAAVEPPNDPTDHPLVKGVMEKFAAKIIEVRRKNT